MRPPYGGERRGGKRFFGRGGVKFALLQLLAESPMHGYQMMKKLEELSGGHYVPSAGTVYPVLAMLEEAELILSVEEEGKKVYSITEHGRKMLSELPHRHHRPPGGEWLSEEEAEKFRHERRRHKLGLSEAGYALLLTLSEAERGARGNEALEGQLQAFIVSTNQKFSDWMQDNGLGRSKPSSEDEE